MSAAWKQVETIVSEVGTGENGKLTRLRNVRHVYEHSWTTKACVNRKGWTWQDCKRERGMRAGFVYAFMRMNAYDLQIFNDIDINNSHDIFIYTYIWR